MQVELERIAELVRLGLVGPLVTETFAVLLVLTDALLGELGEQVAQGVGADRPQPPRRELEPAFAILDQPGVLEHLGELAQPLERAGGVVAEQIADAIHVGLGQGRRGGGALEQVLELIEVAQLLHRLHRLGEAHRILTVEVVRLAPVHLGEHPLQVGPELIELPPQVHVAEQLIGEVLQLRPLLG